MPKISIGNEKGEVDRTGLAQNKDERGGHRTTSKKTTGNKPKYLLKVRDLTDAAEDFHKDIARRNERLSESLEIQLLSELQSTDGPTVPSTPLSENTTVLSENLDEIITSATIASDLEQKVLEQQETVLEQQESTSPQRVHSTGAEPTPSQKLDKKRLPMQRLLSLARREFQSFVESDVSSMPSTGLTSLEEPDSAKFSVEQSDDSQKNVKKTGVSITDDTKFSDASAATDKKFKFLDDSDASFSCKLTSVSEELMDRALRFDAEEHKTGAKALSLGMRLEYGRAPTACERFSDVEDYAKILVDNIAEEAILKWRSRQQESNVHFFDGIEFTAESDNVSSIGSIGTYVCVLEWPTIEQFTIELGTDKIMEYVSYWNVKEDWKYCINFLYGQSDAACDFYRYEAIFSIPCKQYPIPQATASVYFTFEASRIKPKTCLVDVHFVFEGQRLMHKPSAIFSFQEQQLFHIVDAKISFYKTLKF